MKPVHNPTRNRVVHRRGNMSGVIVASERCQLGCEECIKKAQYVIQLDRIPEGYNKSIWYGCPDNWELV